jgi:hypothetical protein
VFVGHHSKTTLIWADIHDRPVLRNSPGVENLSMEIHRFERGGRPFCRQAVGQQVLRVEEAEDTSHIRAQCGWLRLKTVQECVGREAHALQVG